jgi:hypothetical protein
MGGQANHEADRQALVHEPLPVRGPPHLRQVLAHPGQLVVRERVWSALRPRSFGHGRTSASQFRSAASLPLVVLHADHTHTDGSKAITLPLLLAHPPDTHERSASTGR